MSQIDLEAHLSVIVGKEGKDREAVDIRLALERYPHLVGFQNGPELLLLSPEINCFADLVEIQNLDGKYLAKPYIEDKAIRLYSLPCLLHVGYDNPNGFGIVPYLNWHEQFELYGIPRAIVRKIENFLAQHCPANYQ
jgi:hypothetical protein